MATATQVDVTVPREGVRLDMTMDEARVVAAVLNRVARGRGSDLLTVLNRVSEPLNTAVDYHPTAGADYFESEANVLRFKSFAKLR